jgi:nucleoside-diphosphate-sugar epimerase
MPNRKSPPDRLVCDVAARSNLPTVILRPGIIFGPGRPLPIGIFGFRLGKNNIVFGRAQNHIPLNYIENLVDAMQSAATFRSGLRQFNVLDDGNLTVARYHELKSAADHATTQFYPGWLLYLPSPITEALRSIIPMGDTRLSPHQLRRALQDRFYDTRRIRRETGWAPRIAIEEAIRRTLSAQPRSSSYAKTD